MPLSPLDLLGVWRLERRVVDRLAGMRGRLSGVLALRATEDGGVRWFETGTLSWGSRTFASTRELMIRPDGDGWQVCFADGRPFHSWQPGVVVTHPCRDDVYRGMVDAAPARLRVLWDVTGPAKRLRLFSRCDRLPPPGTAPVQRRDPPACAPVAVVTGDGVRCGRRP